MVNAMLSPTTLGALVSIGADRCAIPTSTITSGSMPVTMPHSASPNDVLALSWLRGYLKILTPILRLHSGGRLINGYQYFLQLNIYRPQIRLLQQP